MTGMDERFDRAPFGVLTTTPDGTVTAANDRAREVLEVDEGGIEGKNIRMRFPHSVDRTLPDAFDDPGAVARRDFDEYYPQLDRWLSVAIVPAEEEVSVYVRDITARKRAEQARDDLQAELERVMLTDRLVSDVLSALVEVSTREEIAESICERLGDADLYEFAWVGERELGDDSIEVRASAGATERLLDSIRETLGADPTSPEERAVETGELQAVQRLADDPSVPEPVRKAAFAGGLQSLLAIPLTYGSSVYGVVGVYATEPEAFSARERESFRTVGEIAGFAINAARHRNLLLSDSVVEMTFSVSADAGPLVAATTACDATLTLDGMVPRQEGGVLCYVAVDGTEPERVAELLADRVDGDSTRVVSAEGTSGVVEVEVDAGTPLGLLLEHGATIGAAEFEDGTGRIVAEFSPEEDVRRVADAVARRVKGEVVAKRRRERDVTTPTEFREELRDRLTDRQETVLRTAFFSDYFESPRESTAEEVAESLGVTGPTLLYHLRAGQRKLLSAFFDARTDEPRPASDPE
jgi:predicted DNA binding protein